MQGDGGKLQESPGEQFGVGRVGHDFYWGFP